MGLTLLRIGLVPVFLVLLIFSLRWAALAVFAVMALTDFLDGYLARRFKQISHIGTLLDPAADKLLVTSAMILLCFPKIAPNGFTIPWAVPLGVYLKDLGVVIGAAIVRHRLNHVEIHSSLPGKISTTVQLTLIVMTLAAPDLVRISTGFTASLLWFLWWATVLAAAAAAVDYSREGARQLRAANTTVAAYD